MIDLKAKPDNCQVFKSEYSIEGDKNKKPDLAMRPGFFTK
jgi:hypothetical protein